MVIPMWLVVTASCVLFAGGFAIGSRVTASLIMGDFAEAVKETKGDPEAFLACMHDKLDDALGYRP